MYVRTLPSITICTPISHSEYISLYNSRNQELTHIIGPNKSYMQTLLFKMQLDQWIIKKVCSLISD